LVYQTLYLIFVWNALSLGRNCEKDKLGEMEKLPPEKAAEMLRKGGMNVSVAQAAIVLEFLRKLADIVVANYLNRHW
jgi:hypothetical protein